MFDSDLFEGLFDGTIEVEALPVDDIVKPAFAEVELNDREGGFDWVEFRGVAHVEDRSDI